MKAKLTKGRIDTFIDSNIDVATRTVYLGSALTGDGEELGTDASMAERAIKAIHLLDAVSHAPITILMNNAGGDEIHGMAIADAIELCVSPITVKVFGHAMSMGSIILQAADRRLIAPNAYVMIHYGTPMHADPDLHSLEQQMWAKEDVKFNDKIERLYLRRINEVHTSKTQDDVKELLKFGTIFSAEEAVSIGLADQVICKGAK